MPSILHSSNRPTRRHQLHGLTLIELMVTIGVLAVLMGIAAPSFTPLLERWRTNQATSDLEATLFYARTESIRRGGGISLIPRASHDECIAEANEWQCGWSLVIDSNQSGVADAGTLPLRSAESYPNLTLSAATDSSAIVLDRWGVLQLKRTGNFSNTFEFTVQPSSNADARGQKLCIKPGGFMQRIKSTSTCPD